MRTMCRSPTDPSMTASRTEACAASNRLLNPTWNGTPLASITANASSTLPRSSEIGFSQKIALPALAAAIINGDMGVGAAADRDGVDVGRRQHFVDIGRVGTSNCSPTAEAAPALMS